MDAWEGRYRERTPASRRMFAESSKLHVNGVSHNIRYFDPYPFVVRSSGGGRLADVDGNEYTDYWMGHWSLILGHSPQPVRDAMAKQLRSGWMYGTVNEPTMALSDMLSRLIPAAERIRYVASGTEAAMYAVRLARAATGRRLVVKVDGGWHGYTSDLLKTVNWPFSQPESAGCESGADVISVPYNDSAAAIGMLEKVKDRIAGIIVEPVLGGGGGIPATAEYLREMQDFVRDCGGLFMLDEIVTGFRFRHGCLYQTMDLDPDLVVLGKVVGGGMPLGVICGREGVMELANTSKMSRAERCYVGGGTFSAHPMSMTAGAATLRALNPSVYRRIDGMGRAVRSALGRILGERVHVTGRGSVFMTHFLDNDVGTVDSAADAARCSQSVLHRYHKYLMAEGIFILPGKMGAISAAHSDADIGRLSEATGRFAAEVLD